jgi:hypothetical protein
VPQYNTTSLFPTDAEKDAIASLPYPTDTPGDRVSILSKNWAKSNSRCIKVRAAMQKEADAIEAKNKAIGSLFVGVTAVLAASSGLYASLKKNADPTVTALLAFGASGTSVPSFFYLGSDDREKLVRSRIDAIDNKRSAFDDVWKSFQALDTQVGMVTRDLSSVTAERDKLNCTVADDCSAEDGACHAHPDACKPADECHAKAMKHTADCAAGDASVAQATKTQTDTYAKWWAAADAVSQAFGALDETCQ